MQVTIFERHEEGPIAIKFKEAAHAEECNSLMNGRFFGGRQLQCDFWDGTNYVVKVMLLTGTGNMMQQIPRLVFCLSTALLLISVSLGRKPLRRSKNDSIPLAIG